MASILGLSFLSAALVQPVSRAASSDETRIVTIVHVLNRLGFGARPGDVERVRAMGVAKWIDEQLHPERLEGKAVEKRLALLETVGLGTNRLMAGYDVPREAKREIKRRRAELADDASDEDRRRARRDLLFRYRGRMEGSPRQVLEELQAAKLIRATYGERQLEEVLTDFWMNHFNVYAQKGPVRFLLGEYERDAIRPRVLGKFEDLLRATAHSPAMLLYLDNWLSTRADAGRGKRRRGLNENYARELMELHTLGVDGGYTQKDVTEVARCFTGWTIRGLRQQAPKFAFEARLHDPGDKLVLGHRIASSGQREGDEVLHRLATHPATARFISYKLARRLVADEPPAALVERAAETFRASDGDIRAVVATLVGSPEFLAPATLSAKVKTPFELVVSALRASGAELVDARDLNRRLGEMGMPLYLQQPPTGYKDTAEAWVSASGLVARLNFAIDLAAGRIPGVEAAASPGLALASPEFQRR